MFDFICNFLVLQTIYFVGTRVCSQFKDCCFFKQRIYYFVLTSEYTPFSNGPFYNNNNKIVGVQEDDNIVMETISIFF